MRNKIIISILVVVILGIVFKSCNSTINVANYPVPSISDIEYTGQDSIDISISIIETGFAETPEAFVYNGGSLFKMKKISHAVALVQHPSGAFLIDTGLGVEIDEQFANNFSWIDRQLFKYTKLKPVKEILVENNFNPDSIDFILATHLHWDHASGIEDFPNAKVWVSKEEYEHANSVEAKPPAFIKEQYDADFIKWNFLDFNPTPYEVFAESHDIYNDGSVVVVKLYGHSKGSVGIFINLKSGKRYFFTGDLTWAAEAFDGPSEKHFIPRKQADGNREQVKEAIVKVHHLLQFKPEIQVVPSHDANILKGMATFPGVEN